MSKKRTKSFIHELRLSPELWQQDIILKRIDTGRQIYNACLNEALKQLKLMKESVVYQKILQEYSRAKKNDEKTTEIQKKFEEIAKYYKYTDADIQSFAIKYRHIQFDNLTDTHSTQKIATRAFRAVKDYGMRKRGKPRYKKYGQMKSMEGKNNLTSIRFKDGKMVWGKLQVKINYDQKDKYGVEAYALLSNIKYCRIVVKEIRKEKRFYLQLVLEGKPKDKYIEKIKENAGKIIGIDLGPQTIAYVSEKESGLKILASEIERINNNKTKIQKILARKLRINNNNNFEKDFYVKKDKKVIKKQGKMKKKKSLEKWYKSKSYKKEQQKYREINRKEQAIKKESHNRLINHLLTLGTNFKLEKISYKAWQKMFGKSIGVRSPGLFVSMLRRKAENAGGSVIEFNTQTTALSQVCICGRKVKKPLSQRIHSCECGVKQQRDIFSAYLALFVVDNKLDYIAAESSYTGFEQRLRLAIQNIKELSPSDLKVLCLGKTEIEILANLNFNKNKTVVVDAVAFKARATNLVFSILKPSSFMVE